MKILTIIGARPQFVKAVVVSIELFKHNNVKKIILYRGLAKKCLKYFKEIQIPEPDYNLNVNNLGHLAMNGQMLEGIEKIIIDEKPDFVMVYGDTNLTLAGAFATS